MKAMSKDEMTSLSDDDADGPLARVAVQSVDISID